MKTQGTLFFHGYGVRGETWDRVRAALGTRIGQSVAPDIAARDIDELMSFARGRARRFSYEVDGPILVVGHSLGAILSALVCQNPGPPVIGGAVLISPPYGERENLPGPLMRFLLRRRLVPPALLRPRFFSRATPREIQRAIFAAAVPEAPALREVTLQPRFFHTDLFSGPLPVPSLVLASTTDRIVPAHQSEAFAAVLGSELVVLPESDSVGHDDFFASPEVAERTAEIIADFASRLS
jgi:pimeloyl-ACP methyl ester carboxylesterase